jgi:hypothetical protein
MRAAAGAAMNASTLHHVQWAWKATVRRCWDACGISILRPPNGDPSEGTWYELRPGGIPSVGVAKPLRFANQAQAEEVAVRIRARHPSFSFVEIVTYEVRDGRRSEITVASRV